MSIFKKKVNQPLLEFPDNKVNSDVRAIMVNYIESDEFLTKLSNVVIPKLVNYFEEHYDLLSNKQFQQEMESKRTYLNKLDNYLVERREFKTRIEKELSEFLCLTKTQMEESLNKFSQDIIKEVSNIEIKHQINNEGLSNEK